MTTSGTPVQSKALLALWDSFQGKRLGEGFEERSRVADFRDNLLPLVAPEDFESELRQGKGQELEGKFLAIHSSSALVVNCFAPFRSRIGDLALPVKGKFHELRFEQKCPIGLRGTPPHLDVLLAGSAGVVGIESKLIEHLEEQGSADFRPAYQTIEDERSEQGYFREMQELMDYPDKYVWLDAAQLIKHALGMARTFRRERRATLLYVYWEPANSESFPQFKDHRREIRIFAEAVAGANPDFAAVSYPELWELWRKRAKKRSWLTEHLAQLEARYRVLI